MENLTRDTAESYLWNQIAVTLDGLTLTLATVIVGRVLGPEALGLFGWVLSTAGLVTLAAGLGLKEGTTVLLQQLQGDTDGQSGLFRRCMALRAAGAAAAGVAMTAVLISARGVTVALAAAGALYVIVVLFSGLLSSFNIAFFQTSTVARGKAVSSATSLALVAVGAAVGSLWVVFGGLALGALAGAIVFFVPLRGLAVGASPGYRLRGLLDLSAALWVISVANYLLGVQTAPMILKAAGVSTGEIGLFTAALTIALVAGRAFMGGFANVTLAAFSRAWTDGGPEGLARMYSLYVRVTAIFGVPILLGTIVFAPLLARIPVKQDAGRAALVLTILAGAFLVNRVLGGGAHSTALYAAGLHRPGLAIRSVFALCSVVATYFAARYCGMVGAAAASGGAGVAVVAAEYLLLRVRRRIAMPWRPLLKLAAACGAIALAAKVIETQRGAFAAGFSLVVFIVGSYSALAVARPLSHGEVALIGVKGRLARIMRRFESPESDGN